jgi:hypothetical protein
LCISIHYSVYFQQRKVHVLCNNNCLIAMECPRRCTEGNIAICSIDLTLCAEGGISHLSRPHRKQLLLYLLLPTVFKRSTNKTKTVQTPLTTSRLLIDMKFAQTATHHHLIMTLLKCSPFNFDEDLQIKNHNQHTSMKMIDATPTKTAQ